MSYATSPGGDPINPNPFTYSQISMTGDISLVWPSNTQDATYTATDWIDIMSSASYTVTMPAANEGGTGAEVVFNNYGSYTITINDADGGNITTVASGITKRIWITDNSTTAGSWRIANIGSGTTDADASMLAGYGIVAQAGLLSQSMPPTNYNTSTTINAGARAGLIRWTSGAGTLTLTNPSTLGSNWFTNINNAGSGILTLDATGYNIDGQATVSVSPGEGFTLVTNGATFNTIGKPSPTTTSYTLLTKSVAGSSNVTLTSAETAYSIIYLTGALTGNISVIVPNAVNEWVMYNNTSGAYSVTVRTSAGTGVSWTQGTRRILNCDGTDVYFSDSVGTGTVTSIATGTGLTGGPITTTGTISISNTAVVAGSYPSAGVLNITVNAQGQLTSASAGTDLTMLAGGAIKTGTSAGNTFLLQAYDTDGTAYTTMATLTANNTPTMDLNTGVTIGSAYIYRVGGTDVAVSDGGTGASSLTAGNLILGNGTSAVQFVAPGTAGNKLVSTGTTWTSSVSPAYAKYTYDVASGTNAGTATSGTWATRPVNTELYDDIGISLSSNAITLPSGTYYMSGYIVFGASDATITQVKAKVRNTSDSSDAGFFLTGCTPSGGSSLTPNYILSMNKEKVTIASAKTFEIQYYIASARANVSLGQAYSSPGTIERYVEWVIEKAI